MPIFSFFLFLGLLVLYYFRFSLKILIIARIVLLFYIFFRHLTFLWTFFVKWDISIIKWNSLFIFWSLIFLNSSVIFNIDSRIRDSLFLKSPLKFSLFISPIKSPPDSTWIISQIIKMLPLCTTLIVFIWSSLVSFYHWLSWKLKNKIYY